MGWLQQKGLAIVERARLEQILQEQAIRLTHSPEDQAQLLRMGQLAGANLVVFMEVSGSRGTHGEYLGMYGGMACFETVYQVRVSVRAANLETAEVVWAGSAHFEKSISKLEEGITNLTRIALERAWCDKDRWRHGSCQAQR